MTYNSGYHWKIKIFGMGVGWQVPSCKILNSLLKIFFYYRKQETALVGLDDYPAINEHTSEASTIRFQFSNQHVVEQQVEGSTTASSVQGDLPAAGSGLLLEGGHLSEYRGPECYIKPKSKSNLKIIRNAICSVCLAGEVNMSLKEKTLAVSRDLAM